MYSINLFDLKLFKIEWELDEIESSKTVIIENSSKKNILSTKPINTKYANDFFSNVNDISDLIELIKKFNHPLKQFSSNTIIPDLVKRSKILFITDFPTLNDDINGRLFFSSEGELFNKIIKSIELTREDISITPILFWRPPGGRTPTEEEISLTMPIIDKIIKISEPKVIVTLGALASKIILKIDINRLHGKFYEFYGITTVPIYHPNYLLINKDSKREVWETLKKIQNLLKNE